MRQYNLQIGDMEKIPKPNESGSVERMQNNNEVRIEPVERERHDTMDAASLAALSERIARSDEEKLGQVRDGIAAVGNAEESDGLFAPQKIRQAQTEGTKTGAMEKVPGLSTGEKMRAAALEVKMRSKRFVKQLFSKEKTDSAELHHNVDAIYDSFNMYPENISQMNDHMDLLFQGLGNQGEFATTAESLSKFFYLQDILEEKSNIMHDDDFDKKQADTVGMLRSLDGDAASLLLRKYLPDIAAQIASDNQANAQAGIALLKQVILSKHSSEELKNACAQVTEANIGSVLQLAGADSDRCSDVLMLSLRFKDAKLKDELERSLVAGLEQRGSLGRSAREVALKLCSFEYPEGALALGTKALDDMLVKLGMPGGEQTLRFWKAGMLKGNGERDRDRRYGNMASNLAMMEDLEKESEGSVRKLHKTFGIHDFGRYPKVMLLDQVGNLENHDTPYGVIMYPKDEWKGTFYYDAGMLEDMYRQADGKFLYRIVECAGKRDIARKMLTLDALYGDKQKVKFVYLGTHGNSELMAFGDDYKKRDSFVQKKDMQGAGAKRMRDFFDTDATLILASCETGAPQGIGQEISKSLGIDVIAPDDGASTERVQVGFDGKKVSFAVQFRGADTMSYSFGKQVLD